MAPPGSGRVRLCRSRIQSGSRRSRSLRHCGKEKEGTTGRHAYIHDLIPRPFGGHGSNGRRVGGPRGDPSRESMVISCMATSTWRTAHPAPSSPVFTRGICSSKRGNQYWRFHSGPACRRRQVVRGRSSSAPATRPRRRLNGAREIPEGWHAAQRPWEIALMPVLSMINISINVQSGKSCTLMRYIPDPSLLHTHADNTASATTRLTCTAKRFRIQTLRTLYNL